MRDRRSSVVQLVRTSFLAAMLSVAAVPASAQKETLSDEAWAEYVRTFTARKQFMIAGTFRSFRAGSAHAQRLAERTGLEYRSQTTLTEHGSPTYSRDVCADNGWTYPCYVPRGRWDDGVYVSVEPTDGYRGMQPGYFIVVVASGLEEEIVEARQVLAGHRISTFVKGAPIWMGCIH